MSIFRSTLLATALGVAFMASAGAQTKTATFDVKVEVQKSCVVTTDSASDILFDAVPSTSTSPQNKSGVIQVACSKKTPFSIGLQSVNAPGTGGEGLMRLSTGTAPFTDQEIPYQLQNTAGGTAWGSADASRNHSIGTGSTVNFTVYADVAGTAWNVEPGQYKDTVTVEVAY